ncbi:MAG: FKBP-type peptidyl-prolyl cis-trans isomerase [Bacteroidales bacterium]
MTQSEAKVIALTYELREGGPEGELLESVKKDQPIEFLFGVGRLNERFEQNVKNLDEGESFEFVIKSDEAYGQVNENAVVDLPKSIFVIDGKLAEDLLVKGNIINMEDQEGNPHRGKVMEIGDESVKMDFNHPLAGMDLHFRGEVLKKREPTQEELDQGYVDPRPEQ